MKKNFPLVSIIIINWNGKKYLKDCLDSLKRITYPRYEIIITDNNSTDGSQDFVRKNYPFVKIIQNKENLGFSKANNVATKKAKGEYLFFLNNDTKVNKNFLNELIKSKNKLNGIQGCLIKNFDETIQEKGVGIDILGFPCSVKNYFYVSGCALFIKKSVFDYMNGFDDKMFIFAEDVDLAWRIKLLGYEIHVNDKSIIYHHGGGTLIGGTVKAKKYSTSMSRIYLREKNSIRMLLKNYSLYNLVWITPLYFFVNILESIFFLIILKPQVSYQYLKSYMWNISNIKDTLKKRKIIQRSRKITDKVIMSNMFKGIWKINLFKKIGIPEIK